MTETYFDLFGVTPDKLERLMVSALSRGGEYADIFFEYTTTDEMLLRDHEVNSVESTADYGAGIRVIRDEKTGYAFSEKTDMRDLEKAALFAAGIADAPAAQRTAPGLRPVRFTNHYPILQGWDAFPLARRKGWLTDLDRRLSEASPYIRKVTCALAMSITKVMFYNSDGDFFCDLRPMTAVHLTCVAQKDGKSEMLSYSRSYRSGSEMLTDTLRDGVVSYMASRLEPLFEAGRPKGGRMPVVLGSGSSGILLHEAIGHAFEADFNRKGISIFAERMGQKICSEKITVVDDGTVAGNRGALNVDDEGIIGQKTYMVTEGVLTSYLHDRISARHYGVAPTGNGRRESFRYQPIPRMRATYMLDGDCTEEDLIRSVRKGIFVDNFTNGEVAIGEGDFTFYVKSGWMIEDGRLTAPVKDINIIGNGPQALADITGVAANSALDDSTWTCGKDQYCPVSCGMPSVLVSSLTVGGLSL